MANLPEEAERLLAAAPEEFVSERTRLARELRDAGRRDEAHAVAAMRKPPAVVLAVNRAARDRPQAARDAAAAAERVLETLSGDTEGYREATRELERALDLLADVALAHVAPRGKTASDATGRRVRDLLRAAVSDAAGRAALARGALSEELEAPGFAALAGSVPAGRARPARTRGASGDAAAAKREREEKRARARQLREKLTEAEATLREAERSLEKAAEERDRALAAVAALREELDTV